jgi:hypothetical protein
MFVSKRLKRPAAALLCLMLAQLVILASCDGERDPLPMAAKVTMAHR